ncbi:MAG: hypothetical protein LBE13_00570 [Bacteroidales bacterium]|jgi:hypothetical protein|nr:hypothetical protein [Bacteroidales bacterium]
MVSEAIELEMTRLNIISYSKDNLQSCVFTGVRDVFVCLFPSEYLRLLADRLHAIINRILYDKEIEQNRVETEHFHVETEHFHVETEQFHVETEQFHVETEQFHVETEQFHVEMEQFHVETEQFHVARSSEERHCEGGTTEASPNNKASSAFR